MTSVTEHYAKHLAPIYLWMAGGSVAAIEAGAAEIEALNLPLTPGAVVIDLGAGFGMHAIPLARKGARVTALDTSIELLRTLTGLGDGLAIRTQDLQAVASLIEKASAELQPGGAFVVSFRDYSEPLIGDNAWDGSPCRNEVLPRGYLKVGRHARKRSALFRCHRRHDRRLTSIYAHRMCIAGAGPEGDVHHPFALRERRS